MKRKARIIIPLAVIVLGIIVWQLFFKEETDRGHLRLSGNIDVTQVDMAFKIPGRLRQRTVDEGDHVVQGQRLGALDDTDQRIQLQKASADAEYAASILAELVAGSRPEEIQRAEARVSQARFALSELLRGSRIQEIAEAEAGLKQAEASQRSAVSELSLVRKDFDRYEAVFKEGGISRQAFETYRTRLIKAQNAAQVADFQRKAAEEQLSLRREGSRKERIRQSRSALVQAEAELALILAGPRKESIDQARAKKDAALATLAVARQQLAETELFAPFDGVVLSTSAEAGSYLNPGSTVLTIGDLRNAWLRGFVTETDLGRIRLGQSAVVSIDGYPGRTWKGRVSFISSAAEFTPRSVQTNKERTNLVYRLKIQLENEDGVLKPGMPADAAIEVAP